MNKKNKNFFLPFSNLHKKELILARPAAKRSLWFGALLFFIILGSFLPFQLAHAAAFWDVLGQVGEAVLNAIISIFLKFIGIFSLPGLFFSTIFIAIMGLILGWIISPDFISLKFTQNPFVDMGLSITRNFANMGFIIFLVAIALATALRIEEYKAKKTLPTLIIIALLVNFSPVLCGVIIDAANIVMNFFLNNITGLNSFVDRFITLSQVGWQLIVGSGFDPWANVAVLMQVLVLTVFNYFAGFILILFSALFIMRYIMLWILVILSPIAFVSYILPVTRRGRSLLSWRTWWEQLIAWSIIGIIAGFFLYLGFTMISMINADPSFFVTQPDLSWGGGGLGLMNNILPYLIPLVLLWIAYRETKRTSAMFAREIIEIPEKATKAAVSAAIIAGAAAATAGAGAAAGMAGGAAKGLPGAVGRLGTRLRDYGEKHEGTLGGTIAGTLGGWEGRFEGWAKAQKEIYAGVPGAAKEGWTGFKERFKEKHPQIEKALKEISKPVKAGLDKALYGFTKKEKIEDREIHPIEKEQGVRYKEVLGKEKIPFSPAEGQRKTMIMPNGKERKLTKEDLSRGFVEEERKIMVATDQKLTKEEIDSGHLINIRRTRKPGGIIPSIKGIKPAIKESAKEALKEVRERAGGFKSKAQEDWEGTIRDALEELDETGQISAEGLEKLRDNRVVPENFDLRPPEEQREFLLKARERGYKKR